MKSLWEQTAKMPIFDGLDRDIQTEVLIIGGGMTGILCAYFLQQAGVDYALVEADTICSGITKNTTAKITSQHGLIYDKLLRRFGVEKGNLYYKANEEALKKYEELCADIDCDFERKDAYVYSLNSREVIEKEIAAVKKMGFQASFAQDLPLPFSVAGAVCFPAQAQFHPLKFISSLGAHLHIYEHTAVEELVGLTAVTSRGRISAKKIIVSTHFPFINKHGAYFLKLYQHRSYVIALENGDDVEGMYVDASKKGLSFRNYKDLLLIGGAAHRTGKNGDGWQELREFARQYYPNAKEKYHWATQDCMSLDAVPYIGPYSSKTEGLYVATGFNKWGMTSSMVAATVLSDLVQRRKNSYAALFSPSRRIFRPQLGINGVEAVVNLIKPTKKRCPHLGCALKWNKVEHTWDCPCHGSRFTEEGRVIDNPATEDRRK